MATCLSALGDENATNPSITITDVSPQIDSTLIGKTTDFTINVNYDLMDNDYGKILLSIDEYTTGSADQVYTIFQGDLSKGSHVFKINKLLGNDWKNAYVSATLYTAKKDNPLPAEYSAFDYRQFPVEANPSKSVILDMCSLPSAQGWKYMSVGNSVPENSVFSLQNLDQGCILHQDSMGVGQANQGNNGYKINNVVDPSKPFVLKVRARVLAEEGDTNKNHFGFGFEVCTGAEAFAIMIGPSEIQALDNENRILSTSIDNTKFHDYQLEGTPGVGYKLYVDNDLVAMGAARVMECDNSLYLGDGTGGTNAKADIASFELIQSEEKDVSTTNQVPTTISGHWKGKLYQFGPTYLWRTYPFSMDLSQNGSQIFGTSRIELGDYYAVMKLSGSISDGVISYNDSSFLEKNEASDWYFVLGNADLNFVNTSPPVLEGPWTGPGNCWPGSIFLMKQ